MLKAFSWLGRYKTLKGIQKQLSKDHYAMVIRKMTRQTLIIKRLQRLKNTNPNKISVNWDFVDGLAVPAPVVALGRVENQMIISDYTLWFFLPQKNLDNLGFNFFYWVYI